MSINKYNIQSSMNHIGSKIKKLVDEQKITRKDFAQLINKSEGYVYKLFEYENINTELLNEICIALKVPISYFFNDNIYNVIEENKTVISEPNTSYNREVKQTGSINLNGINHGTIEIKQHELDLLRFENDGLKKEVKYLKEIIELLKNK